MKMNSLPYRHIFLGFVNVKLIRNFLNPMAEGYNSYPFLPIGFSILGNQSFHFSGVPPEFFLQAGGFHIPKLSLIFMGDSGFEFGGLTQNSFKPVYDGKEKYRERRRI